MMSHTFPTLNWSGLRKLRNLRIQKGAKGALVKIEYSWLLNFHTKIFLYFWLLNFRILLFKGANNNFIRKESTSKCLSLSDKSVKISTKERMYRIDATLVVVDLLYHIIRAG